MIHTGVYFDLVLSNTTTLLLSLHNQISQDTDDRQNSSASAVPNPAHFSFRPISATGKAAAPVSLLARIDDEEYVLLPNSSSLVTVCAQSLDPNREHQIRIVAPMTDGSENAVLELEGIWLSKGGKLSRVPGSTLSEEFEDEDLLEAENDFVGERHRAGINNIEDQGVDLAYLSNSNDISEDAIEVNQERRKVLEIVTDSPGSVNAKQRGVRHGGAESLLSGVMGWEYLLGEMFGADHVGISVEGMCLIQDCIEGRGSPAGIGDVFFRRHGLPFGIELPADARYSGPYGSDHFQHTWTFSTYVPDVLVREFYPDSEWTIKLTRLVQVLNIGSADDASFKEYQQDYDKSYFDLSSRFEATYISLVKGIRRLAYPKHPAIIHSERLGSPGIIPPNTPAAIPIFIMRPFRGQLEQATQNVVALLRADGDKSVFWLDTSGWLDPDPESGRDFYLDLDNNDIENENDDAGSSDPITHSSRYYRLTEQGNQRVAIFLHMHVCRYLAAEGEKCAFLPQEVYQGKVFDPDEANFNRYLENEKERRLREMFWDDDESADGVSDGEGEGEGEG